MRKLIDAPNALVTGDLCGDGDKRIKRARAPTCISDCWASVWCLVLNDELTTGTLDVTFSSR